MSYKNYRPILSLSATVIFTVSYVARAEALRMAKRIKKHESDHFKKMPARNFSGIVFVKINYDLQLLFLWSG